MLRRLNRPAPIDLAHLEAKILGRLAGMHWYTLIVEPGAWRRVAERAGEMGYATYCPMAKSVKVKRGRKFAIERPLMPGYLFVDMPAGRRRFDLFTPSNDPGDRPEELPQGDLRGYVADCARATVEPVLGCRGFITIDGSPVALHEAVIEDMRVRERQGYFDLTVMPDSGRGFVAKWVQVGAWVQLVDGPFAWYNGLIEEVTSATLIKVGVTIFGRTTPITVPLDWIRLARSEDSERLIYRKIRSMRRTSVPLGTVRKSSTALSA